MTKVNEKIWPREIFDTLIDKVIDLDNRVTRIEAKLGINWSPLLAHCVVIMGLWYAVAKPSHAGNRSPKNPRRRRTTSLPPAQPFSCIFV